MEGLLDDSLVPMTAARDAPPEINLDINRALEANRPPLTQHLSAPEYQSPLRHHRRSASNHRPVKETLNARSAYTNNEEDGRAEHHINQYIIKDEIGRGSFGAVHLAVDQYGTEYAVKEFSKSRLRKRAQSNILRRPQPAKRAGHLALGTAFNLPLHRHSASDIHSSEEAGNPLFLIKEEIAIMKKLDHPNLVSLIEVLDDPEEDSMYMVLEMCKKGVVMKVGLGECADPYDEESCRCWFRDMILGIEYLHAQGVVHRDIKPDNLLLTEDDVLKIVDFGVSEMFEKASDMMTAKSAGSPAFLPPELCVLKHGDVSGRAADIWSMGVSLYCLRFGRIPFEHAQVLDLFEAIKHEPLDVVGGSPFADLLTKLLEKDPDKRIRMEEIREHPWVTKNGTDPLLSRDENIADLVEPPNEQELRNAITAKMGNLLTLMKAVKRFKTLIDRKRPGFSARLGRGMRHLRGQGSAESCETLSGKGTPPRSHSVEADDRVAIEGVLATKGVHHAGIIRSVAGKMEVDPPSPLSLPHPETADNSLPDIIMQSPPQEESISGFPNIHPHSTSATSPRSPLQHQDGHGARGHAHNPLDAPPAYLGIGPSSTLDVPTTEPGIIAESPLAANFNVYDAAYRDEIERIRSEHGGKVRVYLTRRVEGVVQEADIETDMVKQDIREKVTQGKNAFRDLAKRAVDSVAAAANGSGSASSTGAEHEHKSAS